MTAWPLSDLIAQNIQLFQCPSCNGPLIVSDLIEAISCSDCSRRFETENGIPLLFWPNEWGSNTDVTEVVKSFYEENPFPNYEDWDSAWSLREKAVQSVFARLLDEQIPHGSKVLDVGCGTGQLSNFLGMKWGRTIFGADICLNSLKLGHNFKLRNDIDNTAFVQMNLFRPVFKPESFDLVLSNGVLHHTSDPFRGFEAISKLVNRGGHLVIGLYNRYGRIPTGVRRLIFRVSGNRFRFLDYRTRNKSVGDVRKLAWFLDQYRHPHESTHTIGEVMKWFDRIGFQVVNGVPKSTAFDSFGSDEKLFANHSRGTRLDHFIVQAEMLLSGGKEGGFFLMIGRNTS